MMLRMMAGLVALAAMAAAQGASAAPAPAGKTVALGKQAFQAQCSLCHAVVPGEPGSGPALNGILARKIATAPGYPYSRGLKAKGGRAWTPESLDAFLRNPSTFAPGSAMYIQVADAGKRAAIIAYLGTTK